MKERPILFNTEMVKALVAGTKTQTRRIIEKETTDWLDHGIDPNFYILSPYGAKDDILWVRESHFIYYHKNFIAIKYRDGFEQHFYFKKLTLNLLKKLKKRKSLNKSWVTGRFLPKELARIWLQIESIKVERLQDITEKDAIAEGIVEYEDGTYPNYFKAKGLRSEDGVECLLAKGSYQSLWSSINGLDSWKENPWVWAITFKVLSTTGKPELIQQPVTSIAQ